MVDYKKEQFYRMLSPNYIFEQKDLSFLLALSEEFPYFKLINMILSKFPVDIFNAEKWYKAEIYELNFTELYSLYFPPNKIDPFSKSIYYYEGLSRDEIKNKQKLIVNNFLENKIGKTNFLDRS